MQAAALGLCEVDEGGTPEPSVSCLLCCRSQLHLKQILLSVVNFTSCWSALAVGLSGCIISVSKYLVVLFFFFLNLKVELVPPAV